MKKTYKILTILILVIAVILIINEFVVFPIFPPSITSPSCYQVSLNELVNRAEIILTGVAGSSTVVSTPNGAETHTEINIENIIKGSYPNDNLFVKQFGGCINRLNMCWFSSISEKFDEGKKYLLFVSNPDQNNVYSGFSVCNGKYTVSLDENGKEFVPYFADDINNCREIEIPCPEVEGEQTTFVSNNSNNSGSSKICTEKIVRLEDLINQINGRCPKNQILDKGDVSYITGDHICKPQIMNLVASDNKSEYLRYEIAGREIIWNDWRNYSHLVEKVIELTDGLTTDMEKAEAIANWVHTSKTFNCTNFPEGCISPANDDAPFSEIFNSEYGVCLDAAIISTAMFRVAGIPAIQDMISLNRIVTLFNIDNQWYSVDTTFCLDPNNCPNVTFLDQIENKKRIFFLPDRLGHFLNSEKGMYCDVSDFCLEHPFVSNKIMPLNDRSNSGTVIYPAIRTFNVPIEPYAQIECVLQTKNLICDSQGCYFDDVYGSGWNSEMWTGFEIEDMRNVGYKKILYQRKENIDLDVLRAQI